ncbi:hypothetical protein AGMMS49938_04870 [Fibrobacterales bacterium]|nr:hypothetical protein AGMMS49938_04870 [Fibrobacterales bacterium]
MAKNAKVFIIGKNNKPKVLNFSKEEVLEDIKGKGLNPANFKIFTPDE